eukprot:15382338-Alexandrium_andersonii.AAC.1
MPSSRSHSRSSAAWWAPGNRKRQRRTRANKTCPREGEQDILCPWLKLRCARTLGIVPPAERERQKQRRERERTRSRARAR